MSALSMPVAREIQVRAPEPAAATYDAIIVGSGMSGLCTATILAKEGKRVLVLEQHYRPGGYLHRFFRKGGVQFDVGFHYVGGIEPRQVLGEYLGYLGVLDRIERIPLDPEGYDDVRFPHGRFLIPAGRERLEARLIEAFPHERAAIVAYLDEQRHICDGFAFYNIRHEENDHHAQTWMDERLSPYLRRRFSDPRLIEVLLGQNPLYGVEPERTPVALHSLVTDSFMMGPYAIRGGGEALAGVMVERIRELGGEVRTRNRVDGILVDDDRRVQGVRTARGEELRAPLVISCAHPKVTIGLLPPDVLRPGYRRRLLNMEDGIATLSVFVTTRADLSGYAGTNVYIYGTETVEAVYARAARPPDFVFVTVPTAREGRTKKGLHQVIGLALMPWEHVERWAHTRTGEREPSYEEFKARQGEQLLELMVQAVPELRGQVESLEVATPLTNRDYTGSVGGAAYGIHHCVDQVGRYGLRPRMRVGGLFLTGQSVLMPGVCGVTISAFHTCAHILGHDYLIGKVQARAESRHRVAVTGLGIVSPIGHDLDTVAAALRDGRSGVCTVPEWDARTDLASKVAGRITDIDLTEAIPRKFRRSMGPVAQLCLVAAQRAADHAGLGADLLTSGRVGLAVGSTTGSPSATLEFYRNTLQGNMRGNRSTVFLQVMGHTCAANVALALGITGRVWGPNSACTSASQSIGLAYDTLRLGAQDVMLCGGAEEVHFTSAGTFDLAGAASRGFNDQPEHTPRPFDARRDGMVVGEGAGVLVLERWEHAVARGAPLLAELVGFATGCDGSHITSPAAAGMQACITEALRSADLAPTDIDYINAHATGTEAGDPSEAAATAAVFGDRVPVSSTKGQTGHTLGACGGIESIFCLLAMRGGFVPGTRNLEDVGSDCAGPWLLTASEERALQHVMNNNFAFGGINTSLIFRRA